MMVTAQSAISEPLAHRRRAHRVWNDPRGAVLALVVFFGGLGSIAIEISAARLIGPYFGSSTFIWANLIGLTLLYLTAGYYLGGRLADRHPSAALLYVLVAVAGASAALIPTLARPILERSLSAFNNIAVGAFYGSLVGTILLFAVPVTLLGCVSPFAVRLRLEHMDVRETGSAAGNLYAISTIGSIVGSFLPTFILVPAFGTRTTFLILAGALIAPSVLALLLLRSRGAVVAFALAGMVALVPALSGGGLIRPPEYGRLIYETETPYNYVQVLDRNGEILLALNDGHAIHSIYNPRTLLSGGPWDNVLLGSYFNTRASPADVNSVLLLGLAAGTTARVFTAAYGPVPIDGVEIDKEIVDIGRKYFDMNAPNLNVVVADARYYLAQTSNTYDVTVIDAYRQPYIPFQLTTKEFFQEVRAKLNPNGVAVVNAGRTSTDFRLVDVIAATMKAVFPNVYIIDLSTYTNSIVIGTKEPTDIANFTGNIANLPEGSLLRQIGETALSGDVIREWKGQARVFTDDLAPVESVVDQIILRAATK